MKKSVQPCGTWAAYKRHLKYGEPPCEACKAACRARARGYYARRGRELYQARRKAPAPSVARRARG
jgi:hypothetical protein